MIQPTKTMSIQTEAMWHFKVVKERYETKIHGYEHCIIDSLEMWQWLTLECVKILDSS